MTSCTAASRAGALFGCSALDSLLWHVWPGAVRRHQARRLATSRLSQAFGTAGRRRVSHHRSSHDVREPHAPAMPSVPHQIRGETTVVSTSSNARMALSPTIRALLPGDLAAVKALIAAIDLFPADMLDEMTASFFDGSAGDARWLTAVASEPIAVAYYAPEQMTDGTWNLLLIAVHPRYQGQGVGQALQAFIEADLAERGQRLLLVETSALPAFARTRSFYAQLGYQEEARIRDYYAAGEDKITFRRALV